MISIRICWLEKEKKKISLTRTSTFHVIHFIVEFKSQHSLCQLQKKASQKFSKNIMKATNECVGICNDYDCNIKVYSIYFIILID